jgi:Tfp pilus assembly protein PilE
MSLSRPKKRGRRFIYLMLTVAILLTVTLVLYITPTVALFKYVTGEAKNVMLIDLTEAGRTYSGFYVAPKYDRFRISSTSTNTDSNSILENFVIDGETIYKVASLPADPSTMNPNDTVLTFVTTTYDGIPEGMSTTDNMILDKIIPQAPYVLVEYDNDPSKDGVLTSRVTTGIMVDPSLSSDGGADNRTTRSGSGKNWTKYTDAGFPLGEFEVPIPAG